MTNDVSDEELRKVIDSLNHDERVTLDYFVRNRSVGELLALRELRGLYRVKDPAKTLGRLVELGLLERGPGCYNLSRRVIEFLKKVG